MPSTSQTSADITVSCRGEPINEFLDNDQLFLGAFPDLFFLGVKLPKSGSVPTSFAQHLLRQAGNRFAQVDELLFALFNQSQRHAAAKQVAARVRTDTVSLQRFTDLVESSDFMNNLDHAIKSPNSPEARALLARISPLIRVAGISIPFGPVQQNLAISKLCAMLHFFGLPAWFITVSPSDLDSKLILCLSVPLQNNEEDRKSVV